MARTVEQRISQHAPDVGHDLGRAGGVQPVAAEIHAQAGNIEAAGIAADGRFALDHRDVEAAAPRQLVRAAQALPGRRR